MLTYRSATSPRPGRGSWRCSPTSGTRETPAPSCAPLTRPAPTRSSSGTRLPEAVSALKEAGLQIVAADGRAGATLDDPQTRAALAAPTAWLFGNEAWGLPPDLLALADQSVAVPIYGRAESLNLAAAAAVCLYA